MPNADWYQIKRFSDGGFAMHRVPTFNGSTCFSAWFNHDGTLLDAERRDGKRMTRLDIRKAQSLGKVWRYDSETWQQHWKG